MTVCTVLVKPLLPDNGLARCLLDIVCNGFNYGGKNETVFGKNK